MKRIISLILALMFVLTLTACGDNAEKTDDVANSSMVDDVEGNAEKESENITYTYSVSAMQGVGKCVYYGPDANVPNSLDPEAARNKIHIWTKCTTCLDDGERHHFKVSVDDLDFANGDTIQYSGTDSCWDCKMNKGMSSFMWAVSITRKSEK